MPERNRTGMIRLVLSIAWIICFALIATGGFDIADRPLSIPNKSTPQKLREAWLSYHETGLCQDIDAIFVFNKNGMEVWSRIERDKDLRKFLKLFEPLKSSYPVALYTTRPPEGDKEDHLEDPPPSLWQNYELRSNMGDRISLLTYRQISETLIYLDSPEMDILLKQRLLIYAEQILNWNKRIRQYALGLSALTRATYDPSLSHELKSRACSICSDHAQELEKHIGKLASNLEQALPVSEKKKRSRAKSEATFRAIKDPVERANRIAAIANAVTRRVYRFVHPENFTVELDELRNSSLLESLRELRGMVSDFEKSLPVHAGK
ncbi:MAG: hypothetical protein JXA73_14520 [Acidobacteria bacterium]|nr:hypothetical protein [Acidobacteriota bacterium]